MRRIARQVMIAAMVIATASACGSSTDVENNALPSSQPRVAAERTGGICDSLSASDIAGVFQSGFDAAVAASKDNLPGCKWYTSGRRGYVSMQVAALDGGTSALSVLTERVFDVAGGAKVYLTAGSDERGCTADVVAPRSPADTDIQLDVSAPPEALSKRTPPSGQTWCDLLAPEISKVAGSLGWLGER